MSLGHSEVSFNHSCLKVPVDSLSRRPVPKYERSSSVKCSGTEQPPRTNSPSGLYDNFKSVKSYLEFYESIPDYSELHHLSNEEFYSRLKSLKTIQKRFCTESGALGSVEDDFREKVNKTEAAKKESSFYACCSLCSSNKDYCCGLNEFLKKDSGESVGKRRPPKISISDNENASDIFDLKKLSGYEADQESSTLQLGEKQQNGVGQISRDGDESGLGNYSRGSRSKLVSPAWECDTPEFCQKLSEMSFRNEGCHSICCVSENDKLLLSKKPKKPLSRPIPLTSRILLFDKLMMEKEARRRVTHERYSEELRSTVKPFSFTKREEAKERLRMIASNPELNTIRTPVVAFKARPIPKNLFSNYAYEKMKEEEFYRALRRRVRAEELLRSSSLPPSMGLRERCRSKSLDFLDYRCPRKSWTKACGYRRACKNIKREIEFDEASKCKAHQKRKMRSGWMSTTKRANSATDSSTEISPYESVLERENRRKERPHSAFSCSRNNLASVLRIETARKRLEKESEDKMRESRLRNQAQFKARLARMNPAWRALRCDKNEDLALRVAARREEERLKKKNHQKLMESIYGRVYSMPPMFHRERFPPGKAHKPQKSKSDKDGVDFSYEDKTEGKPSGFSPSPKHRENSRSRESFYSPQSCDKSEKVKQYESDDTLWQNEI